MCTNPILIRNKKFRSLSVELPTTFVKVPCGTCDECLRKRAKDIYLRARFEVERALLRGGCGFMCCLTYDDETLPTLSHLGQKYMVFNKQHVIDFIKRLRTKLERFFKKHYNMPAPDFKYLITSEYGTDPDGTHRPHYHLIIVFDMQVSLYVFRLCFQSSLINQKTKKRYFGRIYQCDILDNKRGGVRYSSKYILKDQTYSNQNNIINSYIKFYTHYVNSLHSIIEFPQTPQDFFHNKCIRSSKEYKKDVATFVLPYRHMLQFYMCSNDFGCSAIIERYGASLFSLGLLTIDKLPYSIPKQVVQRLERSQGSDKRDIISKTIFLHQFRQVVDESIYKNYVTKSEGERLYSFAVSFIQPRFGCLYFVSPSAFSYFQKIQCIHDNIDISDVVDYDTCYFEDNNFFELRNKVLCLINLCNSPLELENRQKIAFAKSERERREYEKRKRNKGYML